MPIFRLEGDDISNAELVIAPPTKIEMEKHLESWLENSPRALIQDETVCWIGRQTSANDDEGTIFSDLLGVDSQGSLVIVELKKGRPYRDVVAQLLDYAAWAKEISDSQIHEIAESYFETQDKFRGRSFPDVFREVFDILETDEIPPLNRTLRLFIVAEEIPTRLSRVCTFLRTSHGMDINCLMVSTFQTESGEILVNSEAKVGDEGIVSKNVQHSNPSQLSRWTGDIPVKQVVWEAVQDLTKTDQENEFTLKDVRRIIFEKHSDFNPSTADCQLYSDCVNHPSRHHYPGGTDRYWRVSRGKYRLYNPEKDAVAETTVSKED